MREIRKVEKTHNNSLGSFEIRGVTGEGEEVIRVVES